ncbi:aminopeptidase P N-terminal domain-containing protein [Chondromyces apiculatus]|uniref:Xaa-Pro aminopeptidase n=1 Tax=Chondromyces apiculatus DSM 436 TaxID=1192034 RepID=A0A017TGT0_9BACT|nr:aminopeptidase P N-terminal domain-containing protein [Chondromyces apiculatus]EYF08015.1 Xaa-Pro aminopeptidase [Chondromyces apiculatus DSM 436]
MASPRDVFHGRRMRLLEKIDGALLLFAAPVTLRNDDVAHEYRQDSDFYYLTGFTEPGAVLLLTSKHEHHRAVLFLRPRDREHEMWDGERLGVDGAVERLGFDAAYPIGEFADKLPRYFTGVTRVYHRLAVDRGNDDRVLDAVQRVRGRGRTPDVWPTEIVDPRTLLHSMRVLKTDDEIATMRRAAEITRDAHLAAMRLAAPGRHEYELEAVMREAFRRHGAERVAYLPIVGSGPNATVLHYRQNSRRMEDGELVLIDAGCEYGYYASDVTRTFPVSGTFSPPQRRIYQLVLDAQRAAIDATRPGVTVDHVHDVTVRVLAEGLVALGLLQGTLDDVLRDRTYRRYYMHRTSHYLGMDVHDAGTYFEGGAPRPMQPGMVLTIEPGLYIRADDVAAPAEYRGIGVRIEDDVLVTAEGHRILTDDIPRTIDDVERACRGASTA